ncbi:MAG: MFS transporter [Acidimicrobiales bacterium]
MSTRFAGAAAIVERAEESHQHDEPVASEVLPGVGGAEMSMREVIGRGGVGLVAVLSGLALLDHLDIAAFGVLGPDIERSLHLSDLSLGLLGAMGGLVLFVGAVPLGYLADRTRRTAIVGVCSVVWAVFATLTGAVHAVWQLLIARAMAGLGKANEQPVHNALLADAYPIEGRNRIYALHQAALPVGLVIGPALAGGIAALAGGHAGWRWAFLLVGLPAAALSLAAFGLREPARGRNEQVAVLGSEMALEEDALPIPIGAGFTRLKKIRTFYFILVALGAIGFALVTAPIYVNLVLKDTFHLSAAGRGLVGTLTAAGAIPGVIVGGTVGDRLFKRDPAQSLLLVAGAIAFYGVTLPASIYMPSIVGYVAIGSVSSAVMTAAFVPATAVVAAITPYRLRSLGFATVGLYLSLVGGLGGAVVVGGLAEAFSRRMAIALTAPPAALIGAALAAYGSRFVRDDIAAAAADLVEEQDERARTASGASVPALQVRGLDYSYGQVQVLFGVSLDVWPGEVVALLGTNGAGKSTLLRAIGGLGIGDRGVIRFKGRTITFADPPTRVRLGIVQVPGGNAVFPTLSVADNLLAGAYSYVWDQARIDERTQYVHNLFPILHDHMDQPAGTLSGGEQQMLGIATALMLEPEVLLIDELSLGLAPVIVADLLRVVETLKATGMTIVLVEQSVNVALSIADRAVFMEKGEIRFDGPAADLVGRDDLVRAVFLGGHR